jgi:hypothetical protein
VLRGLSAFCPPASLLQPKIPRCTRTEIKDIDLDETMIRAMARQAEAERGRRAKVIHAEGEKQAAQTLAEAAKILSNEPASLQLRYL